MTPENSTHTGVGATACASASQKWNGTIALLISSAIRISTNATTTRPPGVLRCRIRYWPIWAMFSAPVRP